MNALESGLMPVLALVVAATPVAQSANATAARRTAAQQALNERRFDDAAGIYRELLNASPNDPATLMALGAALVQGRHPDQAVAPLEHAVQLSPDLLAAHALLGSSYLALGQYAKAVGSLERVVAARPTDVERRRMLAEAYGRSDRRLDALKQLREVTTLAPKQPGGWYKLGQAYNALAAEAMTTFAGQPEDSAWRELLVADAIVAHGPLTDAFFLYRHVLERLPSMVSIHYAIARIYERSGHADWAVRERRQGQPASTQCATRRALCEFLAGRHRRALDAALAQSDIESQYWRVRAASELALTAFAQLDALPDGLERRAIRATRARAEERFTDAVEELKAALKFAPGLPTLVFDLASA